MRLAATLLLLATACAPSSHTAVPVSGKARTTTAPTTTTTLTEPTTTIAPATSTTAPKPEVLAAAATPPVVHGPGILARIADCESIYGQYTYRDHGHATSTASGKYGFLDSTWLAYRGSEGAAYARAFHAPEWVQDVAALRLFNELGTRPWRASQSCWSKA